MRQTAQEKKDVLHSRKICCKGIIELKVMVPRPTQLDTSTNLTLKRQKLGKAQKWRCTDQVI